jgi:hypothetical protein
MITVFGKQRIVSYWGFTVKINNEQILWGTIVIIMAAFPSIFSPNILSFFHRPASFTAASVQSSDELVIDFLKLKKL